MRRAKDTSLLVVTLAAFTLAPALLAQQAEPDCMDTPTLGQTLLYPLDSQLTDGQEHTVGIAFLLDEQKLYEEVHTLLVDPGAPKPVLRLLVGKDEIQDLAAAPAKVLETIIVDIKVDGATVETLTVPELLHREKDLKRKDVNVQIVRQILVSAAGPEEETSELIPQKSLWQCPYPGPAACSTEWQACFAEFCQGPFDPEDFQCAECANQYRACLYGVRIKTWSTKKVVSKWGTGKDRCAWHPWYKITSPKIWEQFETNFLIIDWERRRCYDRTHDLELGRRNKSDFCWFNTGAGCPVNGSSYMGDCRL